MQGADWVRFRSCEAWPDLFDSGTLQGEDSVRVLVHVELDCRLEFLLTSELEFVFLLHCFDFCSNTLLSFDVFRDRGRMSSSSLVGGMGTIPVC